MACHMVYMLYRFSLYFVIIKFTVVKHQNFSMTLDVFMPFIQRSHVLKVQHG